MTQVTLKNILLDHKTYKNVAREPRNYEVSLQVTSLMHYETKNICVLFINKYQINRNAGASA